MAIRCIFLLVCCLWLARANAIQPVEIHTYDVLPPYAYRNDQGELTGIYIEIVKKALSAMPDYSLKFKVFPWARAKANAKSGDAFAILPPYFHAHDWLTDTKPKRPYIWPYSLALYTQKDVVICNTQKIKKEKMQYPRDYKDLSFVMWRGDGRAGVDFNKMVKQGHISVYLVNNIAIVIDLLLQGKFDCTVTSALPFSWYLEKHLNKKELKNLNIGAILKQVNIISRNEGYLGYTNINAENNFPFKDDFVLKFDIEIYKMKQNGELERIVNDFVNPALIKQPYFQD